MSLSEDEKYAIMANVPYQIHEGVPIDVIEQELRLYGLDHEIDKELSDQVGAVIHNDDEVIHSVRGTNNLPDLIADAGLAVGNPFALKVFKTLALAETIPYSLHRKFLGNPLLEIPDTKYEEYQEDVRPLLTGRKFWRDYMFSEKMSRETYQSQKQTLHVLRQMINPESERYDPYMDPDEVEEEMEELLEEITKKEKNRWLNVIWSITKGSGFTYGLRKAFELGGPAIPEYLRIDPERKRLLKVLEKYPNKTPSLTGHSLGSVVNVLGREKNIKTITFNPAPQGDEDSETKHHEDSKVYRIRGDPISYHRFRTESDTEPVVEFEPRYGFLPIPHFHSLSQFIPEKPKIKIEKVLYSPFNYRPITYDNKRVSQVFDYCKEYPYLTECSGKREKEYY